MAFLCAIALFPAACSLAPSYSRPASPVPASFDPLQPAAAPAAAPGEAADALTEKTILPGDLWGLGEVYPEPRLRALLRLALSRDRDLTLALLSVAEARASVKVSRAERLPSLEAAGTKTVRGGAERPTDRSYALEGMIPSFEIDLFARAQNMEAMALAEFLASEERLKALKISTVAAVTQAYLEERLLAQQIEVAQRTLRAYRDSLAFQETRVIAGQSSLLDLERARAQTEVAASALWALEVSHARAENALKLTVGDFNLSSLPAPLDLSAWEIKVLDAEIDSSVLWGRPDVLAAEWGLKSAHFDIGVARAAFFPRLSLTSALGYMSERLASLFTGANNSWSFAPNVTLPLFAGGANFANLELSEIRRSKAVVEYEKAVLTAFGEVSDALLAKEDLKRRLDANRQLLATQRRVLSLATERYLSGAASYLDVLDSQRMVFEAEMGFLEARQSYLFNASALFAALGGGLNEEGLPPLESVAPLTPPAPLDPLAPPPPPAAPNQ
ncbi:MAG: efflux transporter outer membrane subunit [Deltaproteobacteria bacterium]|nr:efflux transporter outer membrane subunit [Deltaproteobacteria bacterium]